MNLDYARWHQLRDIKLKLLELLLVWIDPHQWGGFEIINRTRGKWVPPNMIMSGFKQTFPVKYICDWIGAANLEATAIINQHTLLYVVSSYT